LDDIGSNQLDIVAAQQAGVYLTGSYYRQARDGQGAGAGVLAALAPNGAAEDDQVSLIYEAASGSLSIDAPAGVSQMGDTRASPR
jgi:hypothetical protein